ncbi:hypothetical protein [uncultured Methanosphaera sp.]|uniref:hypothetical protein n=1 Tax=uncultured Methanosphaera sp. TaxID=262501 RepID=UPI0025E6D2D9|nr:hypothetical protein [uncultured Methanosphaera sp.]
MTSKSQITDILILAMISGITALLTSVMGISGTIIGAVVTSLAAEIMKRLINPVTEKLSEHEQSKPPRYHSYQNDTGGYSIRDNYSYEPRPQVQSGDSSHISTKALFLFPLVVILIIELVHFLGAIGIIPYDIFYGLESITNWTLFRTIGYALVIMGIYPLISKKLGTQHGIILIIVGAIELIIGYADTSTQASMLFSLFASLKEYVNIAIILAILYTIVTVPDEIKENNKSRAREFKPREFEPRNMPRHPRKRQNRQYNDNYYDDQYNQRYSRPRKNQNYKKPRNKDTIYDDDFDDDYYYY